MGILLSFAFLRFFFLKLYCTRIPNTLLVLEQLEAVLNLRSTQTQVNNDQYARRTTTHTTAVQGGSLSVFIHVITEMTKLAALVLFFYFKLDNILNVTLVSFVFFFYFSLDSCNICKLWSV